MRPRRKGPPPKALRNRAMLRAYKVVNNYREVARIFRLSNQRAEYIIKREQARVRRRHEAIG